MKISSRSKILCVLASFALLVSCGGSGGSSVGTTGGGSSVGTTEGGSSGGTSCVNATLNGEYIFAGWDSDNETYLSAVSSDGNGNGTYQQLDNSYGVLDMGNFTYCAQDTGRVTLTPTGEPPSYGMVSSDGNIFTIVNTSFDDGAIGIDIGIKKSANMSNASLNDEYIFVTWTSDSNTLRSRVTYDGAGNGTYQQLANSSGDPLDSGNFTYNVNPDGTSTFTVPGEGSFSGMVSNDSTVVVSLDTDYGDGQVYVDVGAKTSSGMSDANLIGNYTVVGYENDPANWQAVINSDGNGNGTFENLTTSWGNLEIGSFTSSVSPNGTLTVNLDADIHTGIISSNGDFFAIVDTDYTDGDVEVNIGIRE